tara:strand:- start:5099 stop:6037 length:939 start_codon:yes stop_codon:yes gene_type:complete
MDKDNYKYDVAFSFLAKDEMLATELNDLLQDRLTTFLYSKKQEELAGTDGEKTFNSAFGEQASLVAVLYREGWGDTPWTRIEQTAIKNRAFNEGYDFVIFIPLDQPASVPKWLPKTQLWVGLERWGKTGAASVIEARVQELGGSPHIETVEEQAKRLERAINFKKEKEQFLRSHEGVNRSNEEFSGLGDELERLVETAKSSASAIDYSIKRANREIAVLGAHAGLGISWQYHYANSLEDAKLDVALWQGHPPFPGTRHYHKPRKRNSLSFKFGLLQPGTPGWTIDYPEKREFDTKALAENILKFYMNDAEPS